MKPISATMSAACSASVAEVENRVSKGRRCRAPLSFVLHVRAETLSALGGGQNSSCGCMHVSHSELKPASDGVPARGDYREGDPLIYS